MSTSRCSYSPPCAADGRPVGGSADDYLLYFPVAADYGAERCHSSSWSWRAKRWSSRFLPEQSSTASQLSLKRTSERTAEQFVGFPVSRGGLPDLRPGQSSSSSSHVPARDQEGLDEPGEVVCALFPVRKSAEVAGHVSARVPPHSSSWTPAACEAPSGSDAWVELYDDVKSKTYYWNRRTNSTAWVAPAGVEVVWVGKQGTYALPPLPPE